MRGAFEHGEGRDLLALIREAHGHFERDEPSERVADEVVRAVRLQSLDCFQIELSQILNAVKRLVNAIRTLCLQAIHGTLRLNVFHKLEKIHGGAAQTVREENRRRFNAILQLQKRRKTRWGGLVYYGGQTGDRRRAIKCNGRQVSSPDTFDFREQL